MEPETLPNLLITAKSSIQGGSRVKEQKHLPFQLVLYTEVIELRVVQKTEHVVSIYSTLFYTCVCTEIEANLHICVSVVIWER